jgi:GNAT superfamily N-acetyltransferase
MGLVLRPGTREDGPGVRELLQAILPGNPKIDPDVMRWQYWDNPYGEMQSWVWEDDGRIVCHYAAYPVNVLIGGKRAVGAVGADAATDPRYQGQGLFSRVIDAGEAYQRTNDIPVTFFFPGALSPIPSRARSLGWPLRTYILPLRARWVSERARVPRGIAHVLLRTALRPPRTRGARIHEALPEGIADLWLAMADRFPWGIVKDDTWWRWRYAAHPRAPYRYAELRDGSRLDALAAFLERDAYGGRIVFILDLLASSDRAARAVVAAIVADSRDRADAVAMMALPGGVHAHLARAGGLRPVFRRREENPLWLAVYDVYGDGSDQLLGPWSPSWGDLDHL